MSDAPAESPTALTHRSRVLRFAAAVVTGLAGAAVIWIAAPYNDCVINNSPIAGSHLPVGALALILLVVLGVNPLLRLIRPRLAFSRSQLAVVFGLLLVASVPPGQGLLRTLPYSLVKVCAVCREDPRAASLYQRMDLPPSLFPGSLNDPADAHVAAHFLHELPRGERIPWGAWAPPLLAWGTFMFFAWLMMVGMALVLVPHWRDGERLSFPLLQVQQALIQEPAPRGILPAWLQSRSAWIAASLVFVLHLLSGLNLCAPETVPAVPLQWNLHPLFTEEPFRHLPAHLKTFRIYFLLVGIAFFMPNRVGFSVWFFTAAYGVRELVVKAYFPPFEGGVQVEHRVGAMFAVALGVLWMGRRRWVQVARSLYRKANTDPARRDREAGWMFTAGCLGMFAWLVWAGVQWAWALFFIAIACMVCLLIARLTAETGMPCMRIDFCYQMGFLKLFPSHWISTTTMFFSYVIVILFPMASRVSGTVMASHALALNEDASPRAQRLLARCLPLVLIAGLLISGAAHLQGSYRHSTTLDGQSQPVNEWGTRWLVTWHGALFQHEAGIPARPPYNQAAHLALGAGAAGGLYALSMTFPGWPLHPLGLLIANTYFANEGWFSVLVGWLAKVLVVRFGGSRAYRGARPVFLGLVVGDTLAGVLWAIVPAVLALLGLPYRSIPIQPA